MLGSKVAGLGPVTPSERLADSGRSSERMALDAASGDEPTSRYEHACLWQPNGRDFLLV
jgi:hypothetical protein